MERGKSTFYPWPVPEKEALKAQVTTLEKEVEDLKALERMVS